MTTVGVGRTAGRRDAEVTPSPARAFGEPPTDSPAAGITQLLADPGALHAVYQPIVDLRSGTTVGYEALTRITDWPSRSPLPWFTTAIRTGFGARFETAAQRAALAARAELTDRQFLAVNVTTELLDQEPATRALLDQGDLHGLVLELTDPDPVTGSGPGGTTLAALRDRGALIAVDLVTAGRDELHRGFAVEPDLIKLTPGLVAGVGHDPIRQQLIRAVVDLARQAGVTVVAVGVQTLPDAERVQDAGVPLAQGWLLGRARRGLLPPHRQVLAALRERWRAQGDRDRVGELLEAGGTFPVTGGLPLDDLLLDSLPLERAVRIRGDQRIGPAARRALQSVTEHGGPRIVLVVDEAGRPLGVLPLDVLVQAALTPR